MNRENIQPEGMREMKDLEGNVLRYGMKEGKVVTERVSLENKEGAKTDSQVENARLQATIDAGIRYQEGELNQPVAGLQFGGAIPEDGLEYERTNRHLDTLGDVEPLSKWPSKKTEDAQNFEKGNVMFVKRAELDTLLKKSGVVIPEKEKTDPFSAKQFFDPKVTETKIDIKTGQEKVEEKKFNDLKEDELLERWNMVSNNELLPKKPTEQKEKVPAKKETPPIPTNSENVRLDLRVEDVRKELQKENTTSNKESVAAAEKPEYPTYDTRYWEQLVYRKIKEWVKRKYQEMNAAADRKIEKFQLFSLVEDFIERKLKTEDLIWKITTKDAVAEKTSLVRPNLKKAALVGTLGLAAALAQRGPAPENVEAVLEAESKNLVVETEARSLPEELAKKVVIEKKVEIPETKAPESVSKEVPLETTIIHEDAPLPLVDTAQEKTIIHTDEVAPLSKTEQSTPEYLTITEEKVPETNTEQVTRNGEEKARAFLDEMYVSYNIPPQFGIEKLSAKGVSELPFGSFIPRVPREVDVSSYWDNVQSRNTRVAILQDIHKEITTISKEIGHGPSPNQTVFDFLKDAENEKAERGIVSERVDKEKVEARKKIAQESAAELATIEPDIMRTLVGLDANKFLYQHVLGGKIISSGSWEFGKEGNSPKVQDGIRKMAQHLLNLREIGRAGGNERAGNPKDETVGQYMNRIASSY